MTSLRWYSGPRGASWYETDTALARALEAAGVTGPIEVIPLGGQQNIEALRADPRALATTVDVLVDAAVRGGAPYRRPFPELRPLWSSGAPIPYHVVEARDVPRRTLRSALLDGGARIGVPPAATSDELTFHRILAALGTGYDALARERTTVHHGDYDELHDRFLDGSIDYFFGATTAPSRTLTDMAEHRSSRLLPFDRPLRHRLRPYGYGSGVIREAAYPTMTSRPIATITMTGVVVTTTAMPDALRSQILAIADNENAAARAPAPHRMREKEKET